MFNQLPQHSPVTRSESEEVLYRSVAAKGPLLDRVFSMRYKSYSSEDYIEKDESKKFMDEYDALPNCNSYLVYSDKKAIASIRSCIYDPEKPYSVPAMEVFEREIDNRIGLNSKFMEINKFVVDPDFQRSGGAKVRFELFACMAREGFEKNVEHVVLAVRPKHVRFYKMILNCEVISDVKCYPHLNFDTVLMLMNNIQNVKEFVFSKAV